MVNKTTTKVKKEKKHVKVGIVKIRATFNNTIISVTDLKGNLLVGSSSGAHKFKGAKKSTPYAAQTIATYVMKQAVDLYGMQRVTVEVKGPGSGRDAAVREIYNSTNMQIISVCDKTPIAHNGCRPRKKRRQ